MIIALGTTSEQKQKYLEEVIQEIGIDAQILLANVESGVSDQPKSQQETETGSSNRAMAALKEKSEADIGLGVEVGYHQGKKGWEMFCCATVVGRRDYLESCISSRFPLPKYHQEVLDNDKYLGEYVREYKKNVDEPVVNYVRELVRGRKPLIVEAIRNVLLSYLVN
jgi:non-canonical (house-cleaning) NTP pyrophosphatase